jgi:lipoprotein-anchoring transpeptidase ErfK/SrfK
MRSRDFAPLFAPLSVLALHACGKNSGTPLPDASSEAAPVTIVEQLPDASAAEPVWLAPMIVSAPVMSAIAMPGRDGRGVTDDGEIKGFRIGYLRVGSRVRVRPEPHRTERCPEGFYELVEGGFVCGKYATVDLKNPKVRYAPHAPLADGPLPYEYGFNTGQGTPMYRRVPKHEDRLKLEPWLVPKPKSSAPEPENPYEAPPAEATPEPSPSPAGEPSDASVPWYLRDYDGGKPQIRLDELRERGPVARRMVKGFFVSLDKQFKSDNATWWRTMNGLIVPVERIAVQPPKTDFHGVWLGERREAPAEEAGEVDAGTKEAHGRPPWVPSHPIANLPVGLFAGTRGKKYAVNETKKTVMLTGVVPRFTIAGLTGKTAELRGRLYRETDDGWWLADDEAVVPQPGPPPEGLVPGEKWIDVDVTNEWLIALEGDRPVYITLISSGKKDDHDEEKDHRTVTGSFRITAKHVSATMDDDSATDGPYSIEDVPWIMYFKGSFALHAAFWHGDFGHRRSHGCVNLAPHDAKAMFEWTEPKLPSGWHAIFTLPEQSGTRVVVHE